jgi:hypothetical protein
MSKEKDRVMRHWFNFEPYDARGVNMHTDGWTIRSWHTAIAYHEEGPTVWVNTTTYSGYTTRHQHTVRMFVRDHVALNDIVVVHMLPWDVYGFDLKNYARDVNPQKRVDLQDVMRSAQATAKELRHDLEPFEVNGADYNYGAWTNCKLCGAGVRVIPQFIYTNNWSYSNRHFKARGAGIRWRCNPRLQPVVEAGTDELLEQLGSQLLAKMDDSTRLRELED